MTPDERQALREKHTPKPEVWLDGVERAHCHYCSDELGYAIPIPCDVIKVLDAWEATL
jgi:hypothetical protein